MEEIAAVYARALFEAALEQDKLDTVREQLAEFADAVDSQRELQVFLFSPYFSTEEKREGLERAVVDAEPLFVNFLGLLSEKHRLPAVFRIRRVFDDLWQDHNRLLPVEITSAVELDEAIVGQIGDAISEQTDRKVELTARVEPDILGGIMVRVGNMVLDGSIRNRLEQLRKQVARAV
jgi:F-type H+-transporting ATPase subunit delta